MIEVPIWIDLSEVSTSELVEELKTRHGFSRHELYFLSADEIIDRLNDLGCPEEILSQLREWSSQPVVNKEKLENWVNWCESKTN